MNSFILRQKAIADEDGGGGGGGVGGETLIMTRIAVLTADSLSMTQQETNEHYPRSLRQHTFITIRQELH